MRKNVIIYGAGKMGQHAIYLLHRVYSCNIVAVTDSSAELEQKKIMGMPVIKPVEINRVDYDVVLIAINRDDSIEQVKRDLQIIGVPDAKIEVLKGSEKYKALKMDMRGGLGKKFC